MKLNSVAPSELHANFNRLVILSLREYVARDFRIRLWGHAGRKEPLLEATLDALEKTRAFARDPAISGTGYEIPKLISGFRSL